MESKQIRIKLIKSAFGRVPKHRKTLAALGLRRIDDVVVKNDTPVIRGMVNSVCYLVEVKNEVK
ncbi:50S ribosomal protein L30 [bacterium]|nr:50S ribosomal protein L30 [bacterium]MBU1754191.1 50S ribosomal protein L30 [bacterium]